MDGVFEFRSTKMSKRRRDDEKVHSSQPSKRHCSKACAAPAPSPSVSAQVQRACPLGCYRCIRFRFVDLVQMSLRVKSEKIQGLRVNNSCIVRSIIGDILAEALPFFALDVVGLVVDYSRLGVQFLGRYRAAERSAKDAVTHLAAARNDDGTTRICASFLHANSPSVFRFSGSTGLKLVGKLDLRSITYDQLHARAVVFDPKDRELYVAGNDERQPEHSSVCVFNHNGIFVRRLYLDGGLAPSGLCVHKNELYTCNVRQTNVGVRVFSRSGAFQRQIKMDATVSRCAISDAGELAVSAVGGAASVGGDVQVFNLQGKRLCRFAQVSALVIYYVFGFWLHLSA